MQLYIIFTELVNEIFGVAIVLKSILSLQWSHLVVIIFDVLWLVVKMLTLSACRVSKNMSRWADRALIAPACLELWLTSVVTVDLKVLEWPPVTRLVCIGPSICCYWEVLGDSCQYWVTLVSAGWHLSALGETCHYWVTLVSTRWWSAAAYHLE